MREQSIPGLSIAIVEDSQIAYANGYGVADQESKIPVTANTIFNLASVSKPITAIAALQLTEKGKLNLDAPVQQYVPGFPQKQWPVTCRQLLGHLSGIRHYQGLEALSTKHYTDVVAPLEIFQNDPLLHQPGTAYLYSSYGYNLLGAAIQGASGESFMQYMQAHIFAPAGMNHVRICDGTFAGNDVAVGYHINDNAATRAQVFDATNKIPSGGFMTDASDVCRFMIALFNDKLINKSTRNVMWTPQRLVDGKKTQYGLGWFIGEWKGNLRIFHSGGQPGFSTLVYSFPKRKFAVVILTNRTNAKLGSLAEEIRSLVF